MKVLSVNLGTVKSLEWKGRSMRSGIDKHAVTGPVSFERMGAKGDEVSDPKHHGGEFKAVYLYDQADYEFWQADLGLSELRYGKFGENLTTVGLDSRQVHVGDRFRIGTVELQAVGPRVPCQKLNAQFQMGDLQKRFIKERRPGFYCRVVVPGELEAGDEITRVKSGETNVSMLEIYDAYHGPRDAIDRSRFLGVEVIDPNWAELLEENS